MLNAPRMIPSRWKTVWMDLERQQHLVFPNLLTTTAVSSPLPLGQVARADEYQLVQEEAA